jgi:hypothetical protein
LGIFMNITLFRDVSCRGGGGGSSARVQIERRKKSTAVGDDGYKKTLHGRSELVGTGQAKTGLACAF